MGVSRFVGEILGFRREFVHALASMNVAVHTSAANWLERLRAAEYRPADWDRLEVRPRRSDWRSGRARISGPPRLDCWQDRAADFSSLLHCAHG